MLTTVDDEEGHLSHFAATSKVVRGMQYPNTTSILLQLTTPNNPVHPVNEDNTLDTTRGVCLYEVLYWDITFTDGTAPTGITRAVKSAISTASNNRDGSV